MAQGPGPVYSVLLNTSISKIEFRTVISCHHTVRGWALLHEQYLALCFIAAPKYILLNSHHPIYRYSDRIYIHSIPTTA